MIPPHLGHHLRMFLTRRALAAWCGTDWLSALAGPARRAAERELTPAAAPFALFVAGAEVPVTLLRGLQLDVLAREGLIELAGDHARATLALLPLGDALLACDRHDAPEASELVCWPDDSSYHLARSLPHVGRRSWLDIGCGSAFAPLLRGTSGTGATGLDINPRAIRHAQLGADLSDRTINLVTGDVGAMRPWLQWDLISCNAPIPDDGDPYRPLWRSTTADFFEQLYPYIRRALLPDGLAVIHATEAALAPLADLPGERVVVAYTPDPGFAIAWWRPDGQPRYLAQRRPVTPDHPHLTYEDRDAALC